MSNYNVHTRAKDEQLISFNITQGLHDYIVGQDAFVDNWQRNVSNVSNVQASYNNFISTTLNKMFDLNNVRNLEIYRKKHAVQDNTLNIVDGKTAGDFELYDNYKTTYDIVNNDVIMNVILHDAYNYDYYITLRIERK